MPQLALALLPDPQPTGALFAYSQHHTVAVALQVRQTVRCIRADRPARAPLHSGRDLPPQHTIVWTRVSREMPVEDRQSAGARRIIRHICYFKAV